VILRKRANRVCRLLLFLIFFPQPGPEEHPADAPAPATYKTALGVVFTSIAHFVVVFIISAIMLLWVPNQLQNWAIFLGVSGMILACVQYLPQLWTTWKLQHVMSLSIPMMCIQTPGSFVFAASLANKYGLAGWSSWGIFIVTGCLQGCLLAMGLRFEIRDRLQRKADAASAANGTPHERTALLGKWAVDSKRC
jgi:uncharacterized protein with PQ loop repeat